MEKVPFHKWLPYLFAMAVIFYVLPPLLKETAFEDFALFVFTPACCLGSGIIFGKINGWVWYYFIVVMLIFSPTLVINYAQSDIPLILEYGTLAFMGSLLGFAFHREKYSADGNYAFNRLGFESGSEADRAVDILFDGKIDAQLEDADETDGKKSAEFVIRIPSKKLAASEKLLKEENVAYVIL